MLSPKGSSAKPRKLSDEELQKLYDDMVLIDPAMKGQKDRFLSFLRSLADAYKDNLNLAQFVSNGQSPNPALNLLHKTFLHMDLASLAGSRNNYHFDSANGHVLLINDRPGKTAYQFSPAALNSATDGTPRAYKEFSWEDAYNLVMAARLDARFMRPNKVHIDAKDANGAKIPRHHRWMIQMAIYEINKAYPDSQMTIDNRMLPGFRSTFIYDKNPDPIKATLLQNETIAAYPDKITKAFAEQSNPAADTTLETRNASEVEQDVGRDLQSAPDVPENSVIAENTVNMTKLKLENFINQHPDDFAGSPIVGYTVEGEDPVYRHTTQNTTPANVFFIIENNSYRVIHIDMKGADYFNDAEKPFHTMDSNSVLDLDEAPVKEALEMSSVDQEKSSTPEEIESKEPPVIEAAACTACDAQSEEEVESPAKIMDEPAGLLPPEYNNLFGETFKNTKSEYPHTLLSSDESKTAKADYHQELISGPAHYDDVRDLIARVPELFQGKKPVAVEDFAATILHFNKRMANDGAVWRLNNDSLIKQLKQDGLIETGIDARLGKTVIKAVAHYEQPELENSDAAFLKAHTYYVEAVVRSADGAIASRKDFLEIAKNRAVEDLGRIAREEGPEAFKEAVERFTRHDYIKDARKSWKIMVEQGIVSADGNNDAAPVTRIAHGLKSIFEMAAAKPETESLGVITTNDAKIPVWKDDTIMNPPDNAEKRVHQLFHATSVNLLNREGEKTPGYKRPSAPQTHEPELALHAAQ